MSVRAYRVNKIEYNQPETFNLGGDVKLVEFFEDEAGIYTTLDEGTGLTEIPVETLKEAVDKAADLELDLSTVKALKADIAWAKKHGNEYVRYYCL